MLLHKPMSFKGFGGYLGSDAALPNSCRAFVLQPAKKRTDTVHTEVLEEGYVEFGKPSKTIEKPEQETLSNLSVKIDCVKNEKYSNFNDNEISYSKEFKQVCDKEEENYEKEKLKALSPAHVVSPSIPTHKDAERLHTPCEKGQYKHHDEDNENVDIDVVGDDSEDCSYCRNELYQQLRINYERSLEMKDIRYLDDERITSSNKRRRSSCSSEEFNGPSFPKRPVPRRSPPVSSSIVTSPRLENRSDIGRGLFTSAFNVFSRTKSASDIKMEKEDSEVGCVRSSSANDVFKTDSTTSSTKGLIFPRKGIEKYFPANVQHLQNIKENISEEEQNSSNYLTISEKSIPEVVHEFRKQDNYTKNGQFLLEHGHRLLFENRLSTTSQNSDEEIREPGLDAKEENDIKKETLTEEGDIDRSGDLDDESLIECSKKKRNKEASKHYREKRKTAIKEVFEKQKELERKNQSLRKQLREMEQISDNMQKLFASKIQSKDMIKQEIVKLLSRSNQTTDLQSEISVMQKVFQHVANGKSSKGCVEKAIYEVLGEVIKP